MPSSPDVKKIVYSSLLALTVAGNFVNPVFANPALPEAQLANAPFSQPAHIPAWNVLERTSIALQQQVDEDTLNAFVESVINGERDTVVGIYVPGVLALPVGQQPKGNAGFVTREPGKTTQFAMARQFNTVGILAHNDLSGKEFYNIQTGQYAIVVYGDGHLDYFLIDDIQKYQALSPTSTYSDFVNLDGSNERLSASQLFNRIYGEGNRLVFQTCLEGNGDASWGRIFIIGQPATEQVLSVLKQTSFLLEFASFGMASQ